MTDDPPENYCKPSVDYLFRSIAPLYANRALGVIMTGMGADGVRGLRLMKQQGAKILAQEAESCVVFGMPDGSHQGWSGRRGSALRATRYGHHPTHW